MGRGVQVRRSRWSCRTKRQYARRIGFGPFGGTSIDGRFSDKNSLRQPAPEHFDPIYANSRNRGRATPQQISLRARGRQTSPTGCEMAIARRIGKKSGVPGKNRISRGVLDKNLPTVGNRLRGCRAPALRSDVSILPTRSDIPP